MRRKLIRAGIPAVLGLLLAVSVLVLAVTARDDAPRVLKQPEEAVECARRMLQAVCDGDFEAASEEFYGTPQLGKLPEDPLIQIIWQSYVKSLRFTLPEDAQCNISHDGVSLDVDMQMLYLGDLTDGLREKFEQRLEQYIQNAQNEQGMEDVYDSEGNYLPEVTDQVLRDVLQKRLDESESIHKQTVSLSLVYGEGRWWVQPTGQVLDVISGKAGW